MKNILHFLLSASCCLLLASCGGNKGATHNLENVVTSDTDIPGSLKTESSQSSTEEQLTNTAEFNAVKEAIATRPNSIVENINSKNSNNPENVLRVQTIISEADWEYIFPRRSPEYSYDNFLKAVGKFKAFCKTYTDNRDSDAICRKSLATMFAHFTQETGGHTAHWAEEEWRQGLVHVREMGWSEEMRGGYNGECNPDVWQGQTWPCGTFEDGEFKSYFGRGAKQLSYNYNYGPFSEAMFGSVRTLLDKPELVADTWLNLASAIFFFVYSQPPKPAMLHVIDETWQPNERDISNGLTPGFGVTTQIINGGVECGGSVEIAQSLNRIQYYQNFAKYLQVPIASDEVLGCKGMKQFDAQGAGAVNIYWEQDWTYVAANPEGKSYACKLVGYQTPFSALKDGEYEKCVEHHFGSSSAPDDSTDSENEPPSDETEEIIVDSDNSTTNKAGEWSEGTIYTLGDIVTYQGNTFSAKWWTRGNTPSTTEKWGPWKLISASDSGSENQSSDNGLSGSGSSSSGSSGSGSSGNSSSDSSANEDSNDTENNDDNSPDQSSDTDSSQEVDTPTDPGNNIANYPNWEPATVYKSGNRVYYQGNSFEAKWWTQADIPSITEKWGPWKLLSPSEIKPGDSSGTNISDTGSGHTDDNGMTQNPPANPIIPSEGMYKGFNKTYQQSSGKVIASYFVEWGVYGRNYHVNDIPAANLTHLLYAFLAICGDNPEATAGAASAIQKECANKQDNEVTIIDSYATLEKTYPGDVWLDDVSGSQYNGNFGQLKKLKSQYPHLTILPSVGGWTLSTPFYEMAKNSEKRQIFVSSVVKFLEKYDFFDGVDIDWEYPVIPGADAGYGSPEDRQAYTDLMRDLRNALDTLSRKTNRTYQVTSAIGAASDRIDAVNYTEAQQYMDYIFIMTYDFAGAWENITGHHTPLNSHKEFHENFNTKAAALRLLDQGVPAEKVVLGSAFYGRGWAGVTNNNSHAPELFPLYGQASGPGKGTWEAGVYDYKDLYQNYIGDQDTGINGFGAYYDTTAEAAYLWNPTTREFITYDSPRSIKAKADFVLEHGFGGLMSWEIDADNGLLLNAINEGLKNTEIK